MYVYDMWNYPIGIVPIVIAMFVCWNIASVFVLPIVLATVAVFVSFIFGHFEMTSSKSRNVVVVVAATLFLALSVYFSLIFPSDMASGDHFRNIIPFLNVTFH